MPVYKYDMSVHRFACQPCSMCVCVYVCGWHVLCAAKGPSLEKFSTCHLFRHQLNLKSNQTGCCLCLCLSSTGLSLYISSGCLLPLLHLLLLALSLSVSFSPLSCSACPLHVCQLVQYCPFSLCFSFVHLLLVFFFSTSPAPAPSAPPSVPLLCQCAPFQIIPVVLVWVAGLMMKGRRSRPRCRPEFVTFEFWFDELGPCVEIK